jgi:aryl-alcohol dehydrogenase-like predicted oxidoreductase
MTRPTKKRRVATRRDRVPPGDVLGRGYPVPGSALIHPPLGFGLWALGRWQPDDEGRTRACLDRALERGIRWLDTAEVYGGGRSERILGDALARLGPAADRLFVSTKVSWDHLRPNQVRAALIGSLHRLARPSVDLYLVHGPNPQVSIAETMQTFEVLREEGKIRSIGVSNFSVEELEDARRALGSGRIAANQVQYNLFDREEGDALLEYCQRQEIIVEAYTPLCRGLLAGRYLDSEPPPPEVRRWARDIFAEDRLPVLRDRGRRIRALAQQAGVPMASIGLHWLASRHAAPVFGASHPEQVDEVVTAWSRPPSADVLEQAEAIARGDHD